MFALTMISFDHDLSKKSVKSELWLEIHTIFFRIFQERFREEEAKLEEISQFAIYFENMKTLSVEQKNRITGGKGIIPSFIDRQQEGEVPSKDHSEISKELGRVLQEENLNFQIIDEFQGLESRSFPMDIALMDSNKNIKGFVEVNGPHHYIRTKEEKRILRRDDELKKKLYQFHYPGVPLLAIDLRGEKKSVFMKELKNWVKRL
jgi:hypothetical protein